ncbi:hypothetical protein UY3_04827 [Chelonia mydas]|uniref:Uncharacterized protein n=1 Tax=Chelonia mydas TaxID=8469 RepID=M7C119_CHEMY|nr:hypothetical protein UY3_04827 [Chelonia mydas]
MKSNHQIVIKPADKGGTIVCLNCDDCINKTNRQLSDTKNNFVDETRQSLCSFL